MNLIKSISAAIFGISLLACAVPPAPSPDNQQTTAQDVEAASEDPTCVASSTCGSDDCLCNCGSLCAVQPFCAAPVVFEGDTTAEQHCLAVCGNRC